MISRGIAGAKAIHAGTKELSNTEEAAKKRRSDTQKEITHGRLPLLAAIRPEIIGLIKKNVTKAPQTNLICRKDEHRQDLSGNSRIFCGSGQTARTGSVAVDLDSPDLIARRFPDFFDDLRRERYV